MPNPIFYHIDDESDQLLLKHKDHYSSHSPDTADRRPWFTHQQARELIWDISPSYVVLISFFVPYSGLGATQQHKKLTTHNPLVTINPARRCQRWLGSGWCNSLYFLESPLNPSQAASIPTEINPSHRETPKHVNGRIFLLILCKQSIDF